MILVSDYSTETGLRVRITCDTTATTIPMPAEEWELFAAQVKAGAYAGSAKEPKIPFIY
jgi:hypothetical protein